SAGGATTSAQATASTAGGASTAGASTAASGGSQSAGGSSSSGSTTGSSSAAAGQTGGGHRRTHLVLPGPHSRPAPKISASERESLPTSDLPLSSPALGSTGTIPVRYTCHGGNQSLPLRWNGIPAGTRELAVFVLNTTPVKGKLFFDWALAGLSPALTGLGAGQQ